MAVVQHLSIRLPWHDTGWTGSVCADPLGNSSCILLENIGRQRLDEQEAAHAGVPMEAAPTLPACVAERGAFLSSRDHVLTRSHPYRHAKALEAVSEASIPLPAWSVHAIPFFWLNRDNVEDVLLERPIDGYRHESEELAIDRLEWKPRWVLHGDNQKAIIEAFFQDVTSQQSLVFFYLKHSPFEDQPRRMLVGAACVEGVTLPGRWPATGQTAFPNHMWETIVRHTLRADGSGGILLPVQHLATLASNGIDVASALGQAPETRREFSYATEHVPADTAVAALLELERAARAAIALGCSIPERSFDWLDAQLRLAWLRRGPAPGLPAVLARLGFEHPTFSARAIMSLVDDGDDPWPVLIDALEGRGGPPQVTRLATDPRRRIWSKQDEKTRSALRLLATFDLTADEVDRVFDGRTTMPFTVDELLDNPYNLITCSIDDGNPIPFEAVDRGCFPNLQVAQHHPLPVTRPLIDPIDERRVEPPMKESTRLRFRVSRRVRRRSARRPLR